MSETCEELDAELVSATKAWTRLSRENESRFVSTTPLRDGDIPLIPFAEGVELMNKLQAAKERHHKALQKKMKFRRNQG